MVYTAIWEQREMNEQNLMLVVGGGKCVATDVFFLSMYFKINSILTCF